MPLSVLEAFSSPGLTLSSCLHRRGAPDAAQDVVCLLGSEHTLLAHVQLFIQENSTGLLSMSSSPSLCSCLGLPQHRCSPLHLDLLNPLGSHGPTSQVHVSLQTCWRPPPCWNSSFPFGTGAHQCCPPVLDTKHNDTDTRSRIAQSLDQANLQCWALLLCWCWGVSSPMCLAFSRTNPARLTPSGLALSSHSHFAPQTLFRRRLALPHIGSALGCLFWWIVGVHLTLM